MRDQPRASAPSASSAIDSPPSLQVECIWRSPRYESRETTPAGSLAAIATVIAWRLRYARRQRRRFSTSARSLDASTGQPGAVGTSGRHESASVAPVIAAGPPVYVARDREGTRLWSLTREFYQKRDNAPAWSEDGKPRKQMDQLIDALQHADREGLD